MFFFTEQQLFKFMRELVDSILLCWFHTLPWRVECSNLVKTACDICDALNVYFEIKALSEMIDQI